MNYYPHSEPVYGFGIIAEATSKETFTFTQRRSDDDF